MERLGGCFMMILIGLLVLSLKTLPATVSLKEDKFILNGREHVVYRIKRQRVVLRAFTDSSDEKIVRFLDRKNYPYHLWLKEEYAGKLPEVKDLNLVLKVNGQRLRVKNLKAGYGEIEFVFPEVKLEKPVREIPVEVYSGKVEIGTAKVRVIHL